MRARSQLKATAFGVHRSRSCDVRQDLRTEHRVAKMNVPLPRPARLRPRHPALPGLGCERSALHVAHSTRRREGPQERCWRGGPVSCYPLAAGHPGTTDGPALWSVPTGVVQFSAVEIGWLH